MHINGTVPASAVKALKALQCKVFGTTLNPTGTRTGAKFLRQALRGPAMVKYYPQIISFKTLNKAYPELANDEYGPLKDPLEDLRQARVAYKKSIGKGPPKKGMCHVVLWAVASVLCSDSVGRLCVVQARVEERLSRTRSASVHSHIPIVPTASASRSAR